MRHALFILIAAVGAYVAWHLSDKKARGKAMRLVTHHAITLGAIVLLLALLLAAAVLGYVTRQAREAVYTAVARRGSATVHTERAEIAADVVKSLQAQLDTEAGKGMFFVRSANVRNLVTDPALEANIKAAAQAQFKLQEEKNRLAVAEVEAERKRAEARGEADAIRIKAEAVAKQGGAEYVQLQAIAKWDGKLPVTSAGGAVPFIGLK